MRSDPPAEPPRRPAGGAAAEPGRRRLAAFGPFLAVLGMGTFCSSMILPYMGFFIVQGLGREPWTISVYAGAVASISILCNRAFARRLDRGLPPFPLIGIALGGYVMASAALSLAPALATVLTVGIVGFGLSGTAMSTMFSLGAALTARHGLARNRLNAWMRATISTVWMVGPAAAYAVADAFGKPVVFRMALVLALGWALLWWTVVPRHVAIVPAAKAEPGERGRTDVALRWAGVFVFLMGLAHSLTSAALPLFYVQEVGLPGYAPGLAFTMKTAAEIPAVLSTPFLIARFGPRRALFAVVALATVAIVVLASVRTFPQMLAAAALEGVYYGLYASLGISFVQSFAEDRPARGTASYWNAQMLSGILAGPAVGLVAQLASFHAVIQAASVIAALAAVPLALSVVRRR